MEIFPTVRDFSEVQPGLNLKQNCLKGQIKELSNTYQEVLPLKPNI